LRSLNSASTQGNFEKYWQSIAGYNLANTDNVSTTEELELILMVGAFERLFECHRGREDDLLNVFLSHITPSQTIMPNNCLRLTANSQVRSQFAGCGSVREAWIRDLFRTRHGPAHGRTALQYPSAWSLPNHLLLASFAFPIACKTVLSREGFYTLTQRDRVYTDAFESLACEEHFAPSTGSQSRTPPWIEILGNALLRNTLAGAP
jgi:hypothetical protein